MSALKGENTSEPIERAAELLHGARRPFVLTGAGISAESGIGTFRDPEEGLWSQYDPMELAHIDAFERDPGLVTRWYHWRFAKCATAEPNDGHRAIVALADHRPGQTLVTQNVDGLHQRAGSRGVVEIHGSILRWRCTTTGASRPIDRVPFDAFPPRSEAGGLLRPEVVWFGEALPVGAMERVEVALAACDLFLTIGTSAVVYPAAGFLEVARRRGVPSVEVNPEPTPATPTVDVAIAGRCGTVLPELVSRAFG
ncbi:MAG: NAD-dependent deacylase [Planctomycetota bacterium]